jgi:hypothetical protein
VFSIKIENFISPRPGSNHVDVSAVSKLQ